MGSKSLSPASPTPNASVTANKSNVKRRAATTVETRTCTRGLSRRNDVSIKRKSRRIWPEITIVIGTQADHSLYVHHTTHFPAADAGFAGV